jgi:hypothetical protein
MITIKASKVLELTGIVSAYSDHKEDGHEVAWARIRELAGLGKPVVMFGSNVYVSFNNKRYHVV